MNGTIALNILLISLLALTAVDFAMQGGLLCLMLSVATSVLCFYSIFILVKYWKNLKELKDKYGIHD